MAYQLCPLAVLGLLQQELLDFPLSHNVNCMLLLLKHSLRHRILKLAGELPRHSNSRRLFRGLTEGSPDRGNAVVLLIFGRELSVMAAHHDVRTVLSRVLGLELLD